MKKQKEIWEEAKKSTSDKSRIKSILSDAIAKLKNLTSHPKYGEFSSKFQILIRMLRAYLNGEYSAFTSRTILLIVFALLYFIIPTDAIPDFLPVLGFTDDISILYLVWKQISTDIDRFLEWEHTN